MKNIFLCICYLLILAGCQDESSLNSSTSCQELKKVYASTSAVVKSRSALNPDNSVSWSSNDRIGIYSNTQTIPRAYRYVNDSENVFLPEEDFVSGTYYYAIYPYPTNSQTNGSVVSATLPSVQAYVADSFDPKACPLVAQSTTDKFRFLQTTGLIRLRLKGNMTIHQIQLEGNNGEKIAGAGSIDINSESPTLRLDSAGVSLSSSITMENLSITLTEKKETSFYFVVPVLEFEKGITFRLKGRRKGTLSDIEIVKRSDKTLHISRAVIQSFSSVDVDKELTPDELSQREALIALYEATNGDQWYRNDNWCTDAPVSEWYGVSTGDNGEVAFIDLNSVQLKGYIPEEIGLLTGLKSLNLRNNQLTGEIPSSLFTLKNLLSLNLEWNQLSGELSPEVAKLTKLKSLILTGNRLTGNLPEALGQLTQLEEFALASNQFEGKVPSAVSRSKWWQKWGWSNLYQKGNGLDLESANLYLPDFTGTDMNGNTINSTEVLRSHELTLYFIWSPEPDYYIHSMGSVYRKFKDYGLAVLGACHVDEQNREMVEHYISSYKMEWPTLTRVQPYPQMASNTPCVLIFDKEGKLICHSDLIDRSKLKEIIEELLGDHFNPYVSTNYEADGKAVLLQTAQTGKGVNVVFLGDGFSDRQIADGTYDKVMRQGMEAFFDVEPFKYFRNYFTVYYVNAVSKNEGYIEDGETAFSCTFGENGGISGLDDRCKAYAVKSGVAGYIDDEVGRQLLVITILNAPQYTGGCKSYAYLFHQDGDHSVGWSVAYVPRADNEEVFRQILQHEACGHGFAKLGDEYFPSDAKGSRAVLPNDIVYYNNIYGWYKNIYVESASKEVSWKKYMEDSRYDREQLGLYEGACNQSVNYFRPTETSIMRNAQGGFNAPSREAIYYRIHKLAFGKEWEYNHESFVKWDLVYGMPSFVTNQARSAATRTDIKLVPPVMHVLK